MMGTAIIPETTPDAAHAARIRARRKDAPCRPWQGAPSVTFSLSADQLLRNRLQNQNFYLSLLFAKRDAEVIFEPFLRRLDGSIAGIKLKTLYERDLLP